MSKELNRSVVEEGVVEEKPDGEHFVSRGIGMDATPGCFVCGGMNGLYSNISGFVDSEESGERVVAMFKHGAQLHQNLIPYWIQVKIGACQEHLPNLDALHQFTRAIGNRIPEFAVKRIIEEDFSKPPGKVG
jgi:hypothetical protein